MISSNRGSCDPQFRRYAHVKAENRNFPFSTLIWRPRLGCFFVHTQMQLTLHETFPGVPGPSGPHDSSLIRTDKTSAYAGQRGGRTDERICYV